MRLNLSAAHAASGGMPAGSVYLLCSAGGPRLNRDVGRIGCHVDDLFAELKPQIEALAESLFEAAEMFVRKRGGFLPHGAVLDAAGKFA